MGGNPVASNVARTRGPVADSVAPADDSHITDWVDKIITSNTDKNFVDRLARPELYPVLPRPDLGEGNYSTHLMSWSTVGPKQTPIVYPSVIFDPPTRSLKMLNQDEAFNHAMKTGEYLPFKSPKEADLFTREYKRHWRGGKGPVGYPPINP